MPRVHMLLGWAPMLPSSRPEQVDLCLLPFAESHQVRSSKARERKWQRAQLLHFC